MRRETTPVTHAVWHREITSRTVRDQPAVVIHDLLTFQRAPAAPSLVQHRALVALFPPEQLVATLTVSTPHLGALPDIEATALTMAEASASRYRHERP